MNSLKKALKGNAIFSTLSSLIMLGFYPQLASLFGLENSLPFLVIGVGLLFFAATIVYEIKHLRSKGVLWIIIQDLIWVIGSILLLIIQPFGISTIGNILIADVAIVIFIFAVLQYRGLRALKYN